MSDAVLAYPTQTDDVTALQKRVKELAEENVSLIETNQDLAKVIDQYRQRNMRAWAVDRALESFKFRKEDIGYDAVLSVSEVYMRYVAGDAAEKAQVSQ